MAHTDARDHRRDLGDLEQVDLMLQFFKLQNLFFQGDVKLFVAGL